MDSSFIYVDALIYPRHIYFQEFKSRTGLKDCFFKDVSPLPRSIFASI